MTENLKGIAWLMLSMPCFQVMNVILRHVATDLPVVETVFFRNFFGFIVLLPWLLRSGTGVLKSRRPGVHVIRAGCHVAGISFWVWGLTLIPFAQATALQFTAPIFVVIGAVAFLGEPSSTRRWLAVAIGFVGALIILRPGLVAVSTGAMAVLAAALLLGASKMLTKLVSRVDSTFTTVFYFNVLMAILSLLPTLFIWQTPTAEQLALLLLTALVGAVAHIAITRAITHADLSALQPFEFVTLLWAAGLGLMLFGEVPDIWIFVGAAVIVAGASIVARAEGKKPKALAAGDP